MFQKKFVQIIPDILNRVKQTISNRTEEQGEE